MKGGAKGGGAGKGGEGGAEGGCPGRVALQGSFRGSPAPRYPGTLRI